MVTCHYNDDIEQSTQTLHPKADLAIFLNLRAAARKFKDIVKIAVFEVNLVDILIWPNWVPKYKEHTPYTKDDMPL